MKTKIILLLYFLTSCFFAQEIEVKRLFNIDGDIRNPTFFYSEYYPFQYPEGNDLLFEVHNDSSSNIYVSHYNSELDSFIIKTKITYNYAKNVNPSGMFFAGDQIVIFQTNINGNWDIGYREFKDGSWESVRILSDTTGDETTPVFINHLPSWFQTDTILKILYEKNSSIYLYQRIDSVENNKIIFKGSDSTIFSQPTAKQIEDGFIIAAKLDSNGIKKIVTVFMNLSGEIDSAFVIADTGQVNNPKFQMFYGYEPFYLTFEKGNNIYVEAGSYFCISCQNDYVPIKDSVIDKIYNLNVYPLIMPVTKISAKKNYDVYISNPNTYVNLRNDSAFIFLYDNYYDLDLYVYTKVKNNHPIVGIAGEFNYKEVGYTIWEDSIDGHIQLFGNKYFNTIGDVGEAEIPKNFYLFQNYPNPFNPSTKIDFVIPRTSFVTIKVFDILGREVETLINEIKSKGKYQVEFSGTGLSSGIYFYRLSVTGKTGNFIQTKKMILLR